MRLAQQARNHAMRRVDRNTDPDWKDLAYEVVGLLAETEPEFTSDEIWELIEKPDNPRALGPIMARARSAGLIERTTKVRESIDKTCHARPKSVWRSRLCVS